MNDETKKSSFADVTPSEKLTATRVMLDATHMLTKPMFQMSYLDRWKLTRDYQRAADLLVSKTVTTYQSHAAPSNITTAIELTDWLLQWPADAQLEWDYDSIGVCIKTERPATKKELAAARKIVKEYVPPEPKDLTIKWRRPVPFEQLNKTRFPDST